MSARLRFATREPVRYRATMHDYRRLDVWRKAHDLVLRIQDATARSVAEGIRA